MYPRATTVSFLVQRGNFCVIILWKMDLKHILETYVEIFSTATGTAKLN